jgi:RNA polymerase sigma-70 factor (ECF subfamily)
MTAPSDNELVKSAQQGDLDAFGALVGRHHARVVGLCARILGSRSDADDAAQETFLKAHRFLADFHGQAQFSTWLYRITLNHCRDLLRKAARRRTISLDALVAALGDSVRELREAAGKPESAEYAAMVQAVVRRLPEDYRVALALRGDGSSYTEIAATIGCSVEAVRARLRRARRALSENLRHLDAPGDVEPADDGVNA